MRNEIRGAIDALAESGRAGRDGLKALIALKDQDETSYLRSRAAEAEEPPAPPPPDPLAEIRRQAKEQIQRELIARLDLKRLTVAGVDRAGLERQATEKIRGEIESLNQKRQGELNGGR